MAEQAMSVRGYAKSRGIAHTSVDYQIRKGKIPKLEDGKIDPEYADFVFKAKVDQKQSLRGRGQQRVAANLPTPAQADLPMDARTLDELRCRVPQDYNEAAYLAQVEALIKARDLNDQTQGRLVEVARVEREQFELARQIRDAMLGIVPRVRDDLAIETDPIKVGRILEAEIRQALESAAKQAATLTEELDALEVETDGAG